MNLLAQIICSCQWFFNICYHAGSSTKHFCRPKVKRRNEESSPSDAITPKEKNTRLAGKMRTYLWACPLTPTPQPHLSFPCFCKMKMRGSSKMAWIDAVRTTRYSVILMLCCDVLTFVVKQGVPSDEDIEWLLIRKKLLCYHESVGWNNMFWSNYLIYICYHAGGSTKHFRRSKMKRRDEESSPSDALTPKKRKTRLAGKMRTYLWACPVNPPPTPPNLIFLFPAFVK